MLKSCVAPQRITLTANHLHLFYIHIFIATQQYCLISINKNLTIILRLFDLRKLVKFMQTFSNSISCLDKDTTNVSYIFKV